MVYLNKSSEELRKLSGLGFKLYPRRINVGVYKEMASEACLTPSQPPFSSQLNSFRLQKQPFSLLKMLFGLYFYLLYSLPTAIRSPFLYSFADENCKNQNSAKQHK